MRVTVLSGAGISAESGVPTFRDDKNGLWAHFDPYELSSTQGWRDNPERVWAWYLWRHYLVATSQPNDGHRAIAAWQDHADVSVVTQNVDDLHERAGSSAGAPSARQPVRVPLRALRFALHRRAARDARTGTGGGAPGVHCGGLIRPDIVWFGEPLPDEPWQRAVEATEAADVLVVVGTSAIVYPAAGLAELALSRGTVVIEVNPEATPLSGSATISCARPRARPAGLLQRLPALLKLTRAQDHGLRARPSASSDTGNGTQHGNVHSRRDVSISKPAAR